MRTSAARLTLAGALAMALLTACGRKDADPAADSAAQADDTVEAQPAAAPGAAQPSGPSSSAPLAVADIDRWQRGMEAELKTVQDAAAKLKTAKTANDSATLTLDITDMGTVPVAARAAGVSADRYRFIQSTLSSAAAQLSPLELEMSTKDMPASMIEEMKKGREAALARLGADLEPGVLDALRPRAAELRRQDLALVGARLKAAGAAR